MARIVTALSVVVTCVPGRVVHVMAKAVVVRVRCTGVMLVAGAGRAVAVRMRRRRGRGRVLAAAVAVHVQSFAGNCREQVSQGQKGSEPSTQHLPVGSVERRSE